jgi:hypothetical protein
MGFRFSKSFRQRFDAINRRRGALAVENVEEVPERLTAVVDRLRSHVVGDPRRPRLADVLAG